MPTSSNPLEQGGVWNDITGYIGSAFVAIVEWLLSPVCEFFNLLLDALSFPSTGVTLFSCSSNNLVCQAAGIADAWVPLREIATHAVILFSLYAFWLPFKLIIKYFFPGLG